MYYVTKDASDPASKTFYLFVLFALIARKYFSAPGEHRCATEQMDAYKIYVPCHF